MIAFVWIVSFLISCPPVFGWKDKNRQENTCSLNLLLSYRIYSSIGSFFLPCFIMIFVYARIFKVIHEREKYLKSHASYGASFTIPTKKKRQQNNFGNIIKFKKNSNNHNSNTSNNESKYNKQDDLKSQNNIPNSIKAEIESTKENSKIQINENDDDSKNSTPNLLPKNESSIFSKSFDINPNGLDEESQTQFKRKCFSFNKHSLQKSQHNLEKNLKYMDSAAEEINSKISNRNESESVNILTKSK